MTSPDSAPDAAALLGLPAGATAEQVARTRESVLAFLDTAPAELGGWAEQQRAAVRRVPAGVDGVDAAELEALGLDPEVTPGATPAPAAVRTSGPKRRGWLLPLSLAVLSALVVIGVYQLGGDPQPATPAASASAEQQVPASTPKPVDQKLVDSLEAKVKADPNDTLSMKALGQVYDRAGDYAKAAAWQERVTKVNPKDVDAWLALGVAQFNGANLADAEISWKKAATLAPRRAEIYYNLGFLYMSQNKMDKAREAWGTVVQLDPDSDLAKTVESHVKKATPARSATPSATPSR